MAGGAGLGEPVAAQGLTGRPGGIQGVGLGAVVAGGPPGPIQFYDLLGVSSQEAGQASTIAAGALDRPYSPTVVSVGESQQLPVAGRGGRHGHLVDDRAADCLEDCGGVGVLVGVDPDDEIGDIGRFPTARKLCAWAGLTPAVRNSDRKVRHGHITKMGSPWVRFVLQEAAQRAKTRPPFASFYAKTAARRGTHIATVAVARKLLARSFHLLSELQARTGEGQPPGPLAPSHVPETRPKD
jgi:hypothetical protein